MKISRDTNPSNEEWRKLFAVAAEFKKTACWDWMYEDDIFAVEDPETGGFAYCCIMGNAGEHYAIAGYLGSEGLEGISSMLYDEDEESSSDLMFVQKCLMCSFVDRDELAKEDYQLIKDLKLRFRGRNAWPQFRDFYPGLFPWFLTGQQCRFLTHIITQALYVANQCREDKSLIKPNDLGTYFARICDPTSNEALNWNNAHIKPEQYDPEYVSFKLSDEVLAKRLYLTKKSRNYIVEADTFYMPTLVEEQPRPFYPKICLLADQSSGLIISYTVISDIETDGFQCIEALTTMISEGNRKPTKILVSREETYFLFKDICTQIGIVLEFVDYLYAIEEARTGMFMDD